MSFLIWWSLRKLTSCLLMNGENPGKLQRRFWTLITLFNIRQSHEKDWKMFGMWLAPVSQQSNNPTLSYSIVCRQLPIAFCGNPLFTNHWSCWQVSGWLWRDIDNCLSEGRYIHRPLAVRSQVTLTAATLSSRALIIPIEFQADFRMAFGHRANWVNSQAALNTAEKEN